MELKEIDNFKEWNEENLKLKDYIFFEYLRVLSGLSVRELAKRAKKNVSTIQRIQKSLKEEQIKKSNLQELYSIMSKEILKRNQQLYNTLQEFDICKNNIIENSPKMGIFFWNIGYEYFIESIKEKDLKILSQNIEENFEKENERIDNYLKDRLEKYVEYIKEYVRREDMDFNNIFILASVADIFVEVKDDEWKFIKKFSKLENERREKIKEFIKMFYELNTYHINENGVEENKYKKIRLKFEDYFEYYQENRNRKAKVSAYQKKRKSHLVEEINSTVKEIRRKGNPRSIVNLISGINILNQIGKKDKEMDFQLWLTFIDFMRMLNYAKEKEYVELQKELILEFMK